MMNRRRQAMLDAVAFCIFLAIIVMSSSAMVNNAQGQGGYPAPTAYPGPATSTSPAPSSTPRPTRTPVPPGTPVCEDCQPTAVSLTAFEARDRGEEFWWGLFAAALLATMYAHNWRR